MAILTLSVTSEGSPIGGVTINILNAAGVVSFISTTGVEGTAFFDVAVGADLFFTAFHPDYIIPTYKIPAVAEGVYDVVAIRKELETSADPNFCLIQGNFRDLSGRPLESWTFGVEAAEGYCGDDTAIFYSHMPVVAEKGQVKLALMREVSYIFSNLPFCESKVVYIPDSSSATLVDVLLPVVVNLEGVPSELTLPKGDSQSFDLTLTLSNTLSGASVPDGYLDLIVGNSSLASATITTGYVLTLQAADLSGSTTIQLLAAVDKENGIYSRMPRKIYHVITLTVE